MYPAVKRATIRPQEHSLQRQTRLNHEVKDQQNSCNKIHTWNFPCEVGYYYLCDIQTSSYSNMKQNILTKKLNEYAN